MNTGLASSWVPAILLLLVYTLIQLTDGCNRQRTEPYRKESYPDLFEDQDFFEEEDAVFQPSPVPEEIPQTYTPKPQIHRTECRMEEVARAACLNNGRCVVIELNVRTPTCECTEAFRGSRCQLRNISPDTLPSRYHQVRTAHIAAGVAICTLLVFVLLLGIFVYIRYRRKIAYQRRPELFTEESSVDNSSPVKRPLRSLEEHAGSSDGFHVRSQVVANVTETGGVKSSLLTNGHHSDDTAALATQEKCSVDLGRCYSDDPHPEAMQQQQQQQPATSSNTANNSQPITSHDTSPQSRSPPHVTVTSPRDSVTSPTRHMQDDDV